MNPISICAVLSLVIAYLTVLVINGQMLPSLQTLPPDINSNTSILSPYDACCVSTDMMNNNSNNGDFVVYLGAVALNNDNECQIVCQKQILQQFTIIFGGLPMTRAVIVGNIFLASMPDNSTCAQTGTCSEGICSVSSNETTTTLIPETTTLMPETTTMNMTLEMTNSTMSNETMSNSTMSNSIS